MFRFCEVPFLCIKKGLKSFKMIAGSVLVFVNEWCRSPIMSELKRKKWSEKTSDMHASVTHNQWQLSTFRSTDIRNSQHWRGLSVWAVLACQVFSEPWQCNMFYKQNGQGLFHSQREQAGQPVKHRCTGEQPCGDAAHLVHLLAAATLRRTFELPCVKGKVQRPIYLCLCVWFTLTTKVACKESAYLFAFSASLL